MILRPVRTTQPQGSARVDWSNPNAEGLLGSWVGSGRGKAAFGTDAIPQGNAVAKIGQAGVGLSNTDTGSNNFWKVERGTTYTYTQQLTFEAVIEVDSFTSNVPYISGIIAQYVQPGSSADDRGPFLRFGNGSSENRDKPFFAVMQNNTERGVLGPSLQTGREYHLLGTYDGATVKLFIDGVLIGTTAATGSFENGPNTYVAIGTDYPGTSSSEFRALQGRIYLANVYGTGKTEAQAKSLAANPWQTFAPDSKSLWVPETVSAGAGATTVSSDASASYAIRAAITSDAAASYPVRSATSSDTTAAYPLRAAAQSDTAAAYAIRSAASADALASYYVLGLVQSDTAGSYAVRAAAQSDALASYAVRSAVQSDALASYEILSAGVVFSDSPASYAIRAAVQADGAASYPVRSVAQADAAGAYAVRSAVWSDAGASYAVQGALVAVWADATASYFVDGVVVDPVVLPPNESAYYQRVAAAILAGKASGPNDALFLRLARRRSNGY